MFRDAKVYILFFGLIVLGLASSVIFGWYTQNQALVQVNASFAPMQFNTALGFLFCGIGLCGIGWKGNFVAKTFGLLIVIIGGTTLLQYLLGTDYGIDNLFVEPVFTTKTSHAGRMAPNTALCFSLVGIALMLTGVKRTLFASLSLSVVVLALLALAGYLVHFEDLYGWGQLTRMAVHTASGFLVVGCALLIYSFWGWGGQRFDFWQITPFSAAMIAVILTFFAWYTIEEERKEGNAIYLSNLVQDTEDVLRDRYSLYESALQGALGLYYASDSVERQEWIKYVKALEVGKNLPGINGLGYIDYVLAKDLDAYLEQTREDDAPDFNNHPETFYPDKFIIKFIEPVKNNIEAVGLDIGFEANRRTAAERARDLGIPALTKKITLVQDNQKQPGFLLLIPVYDIKKTPPTIEERRDHFQGWVYAPFIGANFFTGIEKVNRYQLDFNVFDGKKAVPEAIIYSNAGTELLDADTPSMIETKLNIAGRTWTIQWHPNENYTPPNNKNFALALLISGLGFAIILYFTLIWLLYSKTLIHQKVERRTRELRESEGRQKAILFNTVDAILTVGQDGIIQSFNPAAESMFGYDLTEVTGQNVSMLLQESGDTDYINAFIRSGENKTLGETHELKALHKDGYVFPIELSISEVEFADGRLYSTIIRDITETKEAQEKIIRTNEELERSNQALERFAYIASHDLQEPLRKIGGFTERLEQHFEDVIAQDEKAKTYMTFITGGVSRMRELILGLLEYSRVTTTESNIQTLDSNDIVKTAVENLSETIEENEAKIRYENLPQIRYDKVMLTQLFQNLIGNAIKYRSNKKPEVYISAKDTGAYWEFCVEDNGMGMEEKYLERIFEMFQRLHRKEDIAGTGIGLSLCQKIVERYGGDIRVTSKPGEGSAFYFTVPKQDH